MNCACVCYGSIIYYTTTVGSYSCYTEMAVNFHTASK
jgi:hypothetical protein